MPIDILRRPNIWGESLAKGVDALAKGHLDYLHNQKREQALMQAGLPKEYAGFSDQLLAAEMNNRARAKIASDKLAYQRQQQDEFAKLYGNGQTEYIEPTEQRYAAQQTGLPKLNTPGQEFNNRATENQLGGLAGIPQTRGNQATIPSIQNRPIEQQGNQPGQQPSYRYERAPMSKPLPPKLTPQQYNQFRTQQQRNQTAADNTNKVLNTDLSKSDAIADEVLPKLYQMRALLNSGQVIENATRLNAYRPNFTINDETQQFDTLGDEIAALTAKGEGAQTISKINYNKTTKPNTKQSRKTQEAILKGYIDKFEKIKQKAQIYDDIIKENGGFQPPNMKTIINDRLKQEPSLNKEVPRQQEPLNNQSPQQAAQEQGNQPEQPRDYIGQAGQEALGSLSDIGALAWGIGSGSNLASLALGALNWANKKEGQKGPLISIDSPETKEFLKDFEEFKKSGKPLTWDTIKEQFDKASNRDQNPSYEQLREYYPLLPGTTEDVRSGISKATGGYTSPTNEATRFIRNGLMTATSLLSGKVKAPYEAILSKVFGPTNAASIANTILPNTGMSIKRALSLAAIGETAAKGAELSGGDTGAQAASKFLFMTLASMYGTRQLVDASRESKYEAAKNALSSKVKLTPANSVLSKGLDKELSSMYDSIKESDPDGKVLKKIISQARGDIVNDTVRGRIPVSSLVDIKQGLNKWYKLSTEPKFAGDEYVPQSVRGDIGRITDTFNKSIAKFGIENPKFGVPYAIAEDMTKGLKDVGFVNNFLDRHAKLSIGLKSSMAKVFSLGAGLVGVGQASKFLNILVQHPVVAKEYFKMISAAAQDNVKSFKGHEDRFVKELNKVNR